MSTWQARGGRGVVWGRKVGGHPRVNEAGAVKVGDDRDSADNTHSYGEYTHCRSTEQNSTSVGTVQATHTAMGDAHTETAMEMYPHIRRKVHTQPRVHTRTVQRHGGVQTATSTNGASGTATESHSKWYT